VARGASRQAKALPPNSLLEQLVPTISREFPLMGESLRVETNDKRVMAAAHELFSRYGDATPAAAEPLVLRLLVSDEPAGAVPGERPVFRTQGHLFTIVLGQHDSAVADLVRGYAFAIVSPALVADGWRLRHQVMAALALGMLGPARGYLPLHCACVVKGDRSVLLHGPSGAGKSTLAYAAARRGYRMVSEDAVQIGGTGGARVWGVPWQLLLLPDAARFFPELAELEPRLQANGKLKLGVDLESLLPDSTTPSAPLGPILLLERGAASGITRLSSDEAVARIEPAWPWQTGWTTGHQQRLDEVVARGAYRFMMSGDPDAMSRVLDEFLFREER